MYIYTHTHTHTHTRAHLHAGRLERGRDGGIVLGAPPPRHRHVHSGDA